MTLLIVHYIGHAAASCGSLLFINAHGNYCQTFNIGCTLVGNKIVDDSDVVEAAPVSAAPTTSSFST